MTEQKMETKTQAKPEEIRELEEKARKAVDCAAASLETEGTPEEERRRLDEEAAQALDEVEVAKASLSRTSKVDRMVQERREEREEERRLAATEEERKRHEKRAKELSVQRREIEERAEEEAAELRGTLEQLLELDRAHQRAYTMAGGTIPLASTPFKAQLGNWFRSAFSKPFNTGPVAYSGTDPHNGTGLVERDGWAAEPSKISRKTA